MRNNDNIQRTYMWYVVAIVALLLLLMTVLVRGQRPALEIYAEDFSQNPTGFFYGYVTEIIAQPGPPGLKLAAIERFFRFVDEDPQPGSIWRSMNDQEKKIALQVARKRMQAKADAYEALRVEAESEKLTLDDAIRSTETLIEGEPLP